MRQFAVAKIGGSSADRVCSGTTAASGMYLLNLVTPPRLTESPAVHSNSDENSRDVFRLTYVRQAV